jgi:hypothetical protein
VIRGAARIEELLRRQPNTTPIEPDDSSVADTDSE